ncbi:YkvA family protein [Peribacillus simplex]|uniref:YkvA family protein n=1 Tax=Peribacillus simplex TaxID=1478 RepID=UPI003D281886
MLRILEQYERVPWHPKVFTACVVAYAFSPIDLIPDFISVLGYLDDVILVPLGIIIALKMVPKTVLTDCECKAEEMMKNGKPKNWIGVYRNADFTFVMVLQVLPIINVCVQKRPAPFRYRPLK